MSDLPGVSIEGFFKCSVDGEKEIDGKLLPWTLVDYVKQTAQDAQNARQADSDLPREYTVCRGVREKKQSRLKLGMAKRCGETCTGSTSKMEHLKASSYTVYHFQGKMT